MVILWVNDCPLDLRYSYNLSGLDNRLYRMTEGRWVLHNGPEHGCGGNSHLSPPPLLRLTGGNGWGAY